MNQKIKTVIGSVLITGYCLYANILLMCTEEINLTMLMRLIMRAADTFAVCTWLFVGKAAKCCRMLIDIGGSEELAEEPYFCYLFP